MVVGRSLYLCLLLLLLSLLLLLFVLVAVCHCFGMIQWAGRPLAMYLFKSNQLSVLNPCHVVS